MVRQHSVGIALLGVVVVTTLVFLPALQGDFVYDDRLLIEGNPRLHDLTHFWQQVSQPFWGRELAYWRPASSVLIGLGYMLGGGGPGVLHALALLVHLSAVVVAFVLVRRLSGRASLALVVALLFGLHPVQVEGVAWIAAISDPLWGLFALLCMDALLRWRRTGSRGVPVATVASYIAGVLCKETGVMILPMAALLDWTQRGARPPAAPGAWRRAWVPMGLVLLLYAGLRMLVFGEWTAGLGRSWIDPAYHGERLVTFRIEMFGRFVELLVAPLELTLFRAVEPQQSLASPVFLQASAWAAGFLAACAFAVRRRWATAQLGLGLVVLTVLPAIARFQNLGAYPIADRYLHLAVFGWVLAVSWLVIERAGARARRVAIAALLVVAALCGASSRRQTAVWRSQASLVAHGIEKHVDDPILQFMRGNLLLDRFRTSHDPCDLRESRASFERARATPGIVHAGTTYVLRHRNAVRLGLAWCAWLEEQISGRSCHQESIRRFVDVLDENPRATRAWIGLGVACATAGQYRRAERCLLQAIGLDPHSSEAHYNLAYLYLKLGREPEARSLLEDALRLDPCNHIARSLHRALK